LKERPPHDEEFSAHPRNTGSGDQAVLSDACSDFISHDLRYAIEIMADRIQHYARPPWDYDADLIDQLRQACVEALREEAGVKAAVRLLLLAEVVRERLDAEPPGGTMCPNRTPASGAAS
jgi:hypothetical protein